MRQCLPVSLLAEQVEAAKVYREDRLRRALRRCFLNFLGPDIFNLNLFDC